jgi:DNA-binding response OmpR family regulator
MRLGILEDEATQIAIYQLLFSPAQYQCEFFGTIASFLDALREKKFDLLVLDWMLPDGTAGEALKWIREKQSAVLHFGSYEIDSGNQEVIVNGRNAGLTQKEFALACYLFQNQNKLLSRIHLLEKIWGLSAEIDTRTVDTHINRLRNKLHFSSHSDWDILTIYGYSYRLQHVKVLESAK